MGKKAETLIKLISVDFKSSKEPGLLSEQWRMSWTAATTNAQTWKWKWDLIFPWVTWQLEQAKAWWVHFSYQSSWLNPPIFVKSSCSLSFSLTTSSAWARNLCSSSCEKHTFILSRVWLKWIKLGQSRNTLASSNYYTSLHLILSYVVEISGIERDASPVGHHHFSLIKYFRPKNLVSVLTF